MGIPFNDTTNKNGIIQKMERNCGMARTAISADSNKLIDATNDVNDAMREIWHFIFSNAGGWKYDDSSQSDLPYATQDLSSGVQKYAIPSAALTVQGIAIKDQSANWRLLNPIDIRKIVSLGFTPDSYKTIAGMPEEYSLLGQTSFIYPAANFTQTSSFKVFFDRESVYFTTASTTQQPGFWSPYHDIVADLASLPFLRINKPNSVTIGKLELHIAKRFNDLGQFLSQQFPAKVNKMTARINNTVNLY